MCHHLAESSTSIDQALMHTLSDCLKESGYDVRYSIDDHTLAGLKSSHHNAFNDLSEVQYADLLVIAFSRDNSGSDAPAQPIRGLI